MHNKSGAEKRNRTSDLLITNQLLYQLSYVGKSLLRRKSGFAKQGADNSSWHYFAQVPNLPRCNIILVSAEEPS